MPDDLPALRGDALPSIDVDALRAREAFVKRDEREGTSKCQNGHADKRTPTRDDQRVLLQHACGGTEEEALQPGLPAKRKRLYCG